MNGANTRSAMVAMFVAFLAMMAIQTKAQNKVKAALKADVVSSYVWRGMEFGGVSIQPSLSISCKGWSLEAWGSVGVESEDAKEFDLILGYNNGRFSASVSDVWTDSGFGYFKYGAHNTNHNFEIRMGYDFGTVAANWHTIFAGRDGVDKDGKRAYSSYITLTAPFSLGGLEWLAEVGATPWSTTYYNGWSNGFTVCDVSLTATKTVAITDKFTLPLYGKISVNPKMEKAYFVVGFTL